VTNRLEDALAEVHARDWPRVVGILVHATRDLDLAEDAVQDAFESPIAAWARDGIPNSPAAWLITTARRKAIDRQRREMNLTRKLPLLIVPGDDESSIDDIPDERLRLIFTCCHPAIAIEGRVALALRLVCGLETAAIARLFVVPPATMAARLTRAKKKIARSSRRSCRVRTSGCRFSMTSPAGMAASTTISSPPPGPTCCAASVASPKRMPSTVGRWL